MNFATYLPPGTVLEHLQEAMNALKKGPAPEGVSIEMWNDIHFRVGWAQSLLKTAIYKEERRKP